MRNGYPAPDQELLPGVKWGRPEWVPSPAFWKALAGHADPENDGYVSAPGTPLAEDVAFCLLGGFGIRMEVNRAAFERVRAAGCLAPSARPSEDEIEALLREPLRVDGRPVRYRFPRQKSKRLSQALAVIEEFPPPEDDAQKFRNAMLKLPGIGPKTAAWIARNRLGTDEVAIIDIHILRAGQLIGLFGRNVRLPRDYAALEARFLDFARAIDVPASLLDAIMWREMRILGPTILGLRPSFTT